MSYDIMIFSKYMKYIQDTKITLEERVQRACDLTGKEFTKEIFDAYRCRLDKLNMFVEVFGIDKNENINIPPIRELKKYPTLITDRTIQRSLYGMSFFRAFMQGEAVDYTRGSERKNIKKQIDINSKKQNIKVYNQLVEKYGFVNVHPERPYIIGEGRRCDFYVVQENIYIDVFHSDYPINNILRYKRKNLKDLKDSHKIFYIHNDNPIQPLFQLNTTP